MASYNHQPLMIQVYRDDVDESNVGANPPLFSPAGQESTQPRWASKAQRKKRFRKLLTAAIGVLASTYLLLCVWIALARRDQTVSFDNDIGEDGFPHRRLPWPFPKPHPRHPYPHHPPHHPPFPVISVLGCSPISPPDLDSFKEGTKLTVSYPINSSVILDDWLLLSDVAVSKVEEEEDGDMESADDEATLEVFVKVGKRLKLPLPGSPFDVNGALEDGAEFEETVLGAASEDEKKFVLCAVTFTHPPPPPPPHHPSPPDEAISFHPPPPPSNGPPHPHQPPVIVKIYPALNETYPKLPPPPPHHPPCRRKHHSIPGGFFKSAISFLFPMFSKVSQPFPPPSHGPGHHGHGHHGLFHPHFPFPPPPPPPPFIVETIEVKVPKSSFVGFGLRPPPFFRRAHPPPPHPPLPHP
ncbi:hypothetical protein FRC14_001839 [Serendipita sp. 396]|nr:hypothetical protein FRC14_001839 [Serendipita sp. 396]KAG8803838.1 hypothetical protein FRC16_002695 [Serendipita sp. 398]KAG8875857.1 hypothetical protein FRC20_002887 [Serendipita sp. 405]